MPIILDKGAAFYKNYGMGRSRGTLPFQISGNIKRGGLVEKAFGLTLRRTCSMISVAAASADDRSGRCRSVGRWARISRISIRHAARLRILRCESRRMSVTVASVAFDDTVDMAQMARFAMEFCAIESCGKCTPCRIGSTRGVEVIDKIIQRPQPRSELVFASGPLRRHAQWLALRTGRVDPVSGSERIRALSAGFRR